jgi:hypothetical protein
MRPRPPGSARLAVPLSLAVWLGAALLGAQDWRGPEAFEVRVDDAKGRPLAGAEVVLDYASRALGGPAPLLTDAKGRAAIGGLLPGRWALEVRKPGYMSFRAELALTAGERPEIVAASQHNVPGAVSTLRVRIARTRDAPPAPARVERVMPPPSVAPSMPPPPVPAPVPAPQVAPTPAAPAPAPKAAAAPPSPAPVARAEPVPAPGLERESPPAAAVVAPPAIAPTAVAPPALPPAAQPEPAAPPAPAVAPAPVAAPAPVSAPRLIAAAPIARACYECRPGESALLAEVEIAAGGGRCPAELAARLATASRAELALLAGELPAGCALLTVELPANARYSGFRYEAAGGNGRSEDCLAGRACPAGGCSFPIEPVVRREGNATLVLALFESDAARRAGFTVYWRRTR